MSLISCLFQPCEQAGFLLKQKSKKPGAYQTRYFVLKGGFLFYFNSRHAPQRAKELNGVIPLENAKIETELPPMAGVKGGKSHVITITLHSSHAFSTSHPFYVLAAPTEEVQMAWTNALWQAAIPRADLVQHLSAAGKLADVLASYAHNVQMNFPVADAAVLSTGGRARTLGVANVGSLAGMVRRHKAAPAVNDLTQLPMVVSDRPAGHSSVLARTTSGNLVTTSSNNVVHGSEGKEPGAAMAAVAPALSGASVASGERSISRAGSSGSGLASGGSTPRKASGVPAGAVAVSASAGVAAAATAGMVHRMDPAKSSQVGRTASGTTTGLREAASKASR